MSSPSRLHAVVLNSPLSARVSNRSPADSSRRNSAGNPAKRPSLAERISANRPLPWGSAGSKCEEPNSSATAPTAAPMARTGAPCQQSCRAHSRSRSLRDGPAPHERSRDSEAVPPRPDIRVDAAPQPGGRRSRHARRWPCEPSLLFASVLLGLSLCLSVSSFGLQPLSRRPRMNLTRKAALRGGL
jgi:hypothetical protein